MKKIVKTAVLVLCAVCLTTVVSLWHGDDKRKLQEEISALKQDLIRLRNMEKYTFDTLITPQYTVGTLPYFDFKKLLFNEGMSEEEVVEILKDLDGKFYETKGLRQDMMKTTCLYEKHSYYSENKENYLQAKWLMHFYFCPYGNGLKSYEIMLTSFTVNNFQHETAKAFLKEYGIPFIYVTKEDTKIKFTWDKAGPFVFNTIDFSEITVEAGTMGNMDSCNIHFVF
jgi:hypothetical protein